ncbi:MAG: putative DNA binding domain-containing protein [Gemmatimonadaceae bacterium]|nr:putative DNA binding domain-containing protein [Gemmatimonadaceae bacterium]
MPGDQEMGVKLPRRDPPLDDKFVDQLLQIPEGPGFETKRVGDNRRKIETVVAFSNTEGGLLLLGVEDESKARGRDRLYGIQENPEAVDELRRLLRQRITPVLEPPSVEPPRFIGIGCTLRDGTRGSIMAVQVAKSTAVHSVVDGGTYVRMSRSNRQISAAEITELAMRRGTVSAVNALVDVPFDLLDTVYWREYAAQRRLTRPIAEALRHLGLAREDPNGTTRPTRAAVLLFGEEPSGLLDSKCAIRIFHYRGEAIERTTNPNLLRPPHTVGGPLLAQIRDARDVVIRELASGVQVGPLGFEIAQRYPVRVIQEAITNAVIHRDYHISADIHIRIFAERIEVESPGSLPGGVTTSNLGIIGSRPRNRALVDHLREFPVPPNLDAGEGVPMMRRTMAQAELYPPIFLASDDFGRESVLVQLSNQARPSIWDQVEAHLDRAGTIGNSEVRALLHTDNPVRASKMLKSWVELGLLVPVDPNAAKQQRRYRRPGVSPEVTLFSGIPENDASDES